jgi:chromosome segregation ATPase
MEEHALGAPKGRPANATLQQIIEVARSINELSVSSLEIALRNRYGRGVARERIAEVTRAEKAVRAMGGERARAYLQETISDQELLAAYCERVRLDEQQAEAGTIPTVATANVDRILGALREQLLRTVEASIEPVSVQLRSERERAAALEAKHSSELRGAQEEFHAALTERLLECNELQAKLLIAEQQRRDLESELEGLKRRLEDAHRSAAALEAERTASREMVDRLDRQLQSERGRYESLWNRLAEVEKLQVRQSAQGVAG